MATYEAGSCVVRYRLDMSSATEGARRAQQALDVLAKHQKAIELLRQWREEDESNPELSRALWDELSANLRDDDIEI